MINAVSLSAELTVRNSVRISLDAVYDDDDDGSSEGNIDNN